MHKIEYIHHAIDTKKIKSLNTYLDQALKAISYNGALGVLVYKPSGEILYAVLKGGNTAEIWAYSLIYNNLPYFNYNAMLKLPQNTFDADVYHYLESNEKLEKNDVFLSLLNDAKRKKLHPWSYQRYQLDGGIISLLTELPNRSAVECLLTQKHAVDRGLNDLYQRISQDRYYQDMHEISQCINMRDIENSYQYNFDSAITKQLNLGRSELKVFKLIYSGLYKPKEICHHAYLSIRTVEGVLAALKEKLGCRHKEELHEKIQYLHSVIRISIHSSLSL